MHTHRARFKKDIIVEFLLPSRPSQKVVILCDGMPGVPGKKSLMEFFAKKNYWVFFPRYRGTWESGGNFLQHSPEQDILDVLDELPKGFTGIWENVDYRVDPKKVVIVGGSFGGAAALLCSRDPRVDRVVAVAPVVDWNAPSKSEPLDWLFRVVREAFGEAYRMEKKDWDKLKSGTFYNPINHIREMKSEKVFLVHAKDDPVVDAKSVARFAKKLGCHFKLYQRGGHLSSKIVMQKRLFSQLKKFLA